MAPELFQNLDCKGPNSVDIWYNQHRGESHGTSIHLSLLQNDNGQICRDMRNMNGCVARFEDGFRAVVETFSNAMAFAFAFALVKESNVCGDKNV